ncbi:uncharacterized protein TRAVEDRAFT_66106 [Trametes versicolor FP-101664 SS1]|uniref:uncharacterized protein n=1 Tax=Trametes versicolor (strain FP-101664) TaxID=717944 RepID=UPI0004624908|nr:uncharacterized protein TRAVEDRAFT_66106 [Trametes versicolor FP-101664 SS1]EIW55847.1 hypothetical protein TRAVEDRAFT_66106 [Trametes versicolor FP-101664 SS1]
MGSPNDAFPLLAALYTSYPGTHAVYVHQDQREYSLEGGRFLSHESAAPMITGTALIPDVVITSHTAASRALCSALPASATPTGYLNVSEDVSIGVLDWEHNDVSPADTHLALLTREEALVVWGTDLNNACERFDRVQAALTEWLQHPAPQGSPEPDPHSSPSSSTSGYSPSISSADSDILFTPEPYTSVFDDFDFYDPPSALGYPLYQGGAFPLPGLHGSCSEDIYVRLGALQNLAKLKDLEAHTSGSPYPPVSVAGTGTPSPPHMGFVDLAAPHCESSPTWTSPDGDNVNPESSPVPAPAASQDTKTRKKRSGPASAPQRRSARCAQLEAARPPPPSPPPPPVSRASTRKRTKSAARRTSSAKSAVRRTSGARPASTSRLISPLPSRAVRAAATRPSSAVAARAIVPRVTLHSHATCDMSVDDDMSDSDAEDESDCEDEDEDEDQYDDGSGEYTGEGAFRGSRPASPRLPLKRGRKATKTSKAVKKWQEAQERLTHPEAFKCPIATCPRPGKVFTRVADCSRHKKICAAQAGKEDAVISMCSLCDREYSRADATLRHIKSKHPGNAKAKPVEFTRRIVSKKGDV